MAEPIIKQLIERARGYVAVRSSWARFTLALTRDNHDCEPIDPEAVRFCGYGALVRAGYDLTSDPEQARQLAGRAAILITGQVSPDGAYDAIYAINDGPPVASRQAILRLFDQGLART